MKLLIEGITPFSLVFFVVSKRICAITHTAEILFFMPFKMPFFLCVSKDGQAIARSFFRCPSSLAHTQSKNCIVVIVRLLP